MHDVPAMLAVSFLPVMVLHRRMLAGRFAQAEINPRIRGKDGYKYEGDQALEVDPGRLGRLHILEVQRLIRFMPKIVIAVVPSFGPSVEGIAYVCDPDLGQQRTRSFQAD